MCSLSTGKTEFVVNAEFVEIDDNANANACEDSLELIAS